MGLRLHELPVGPPEPVPAPASLPGNSPGWRNGRMESATSCALATFPRHYSTRKQYNKHKNAQTDTRILTQIPLVKQEFHYSSYDLNGYGIMV